MIDQWQNCYDDSWTGSIVPEAFSHPAKFSHGLINRIYSHAKEMGWVKLGDCVFDPFAGVALGAICALSMGLNWIGVELEQVFVDEGSQCECTGVTKEQWIRFWVRKRQGRVNYKEDIWWCPHCLQTIKYKTDSGKIPFSEPHHYMGNIEKWNRQLKGWPNLGTARIVQGDSRRLRDVVKEASLIVSSPPYSESELHGRKSKRDAEFFKGRTIGEHGSKSYGHTPGNLANLKEGNFQDVIEKVDLVVGSPPFTETHGRQKKIRGNWCAGGGERFLHTQDYAKTPGNLANMREGDIDLVVGSPPYAESDTSASHVQGHSRLDPKSKNYRPFAVKSISEGYNEKRTYGQSPGQLGSMKEGSFDLCVSSPPYEDSEVTLAQTKGCFGNPENMKLHTKNRDKIGRQYSKTDGQLGNSSGDTFWSASREIVQGCYELLKPGGHAIFVCKDYVKTKKRVPFSDRWLALCESVGFKLVCRHQAMLVKPEGEQETMRGSQYITTERKSFFRRNHETKVKAANFWTTLTEDLRDEFLELAKKQVTVNPTEKKILQKAQVLAFKSECLDDRPYQNEIMIQNEDVICLVKG